MSKSDCFQRCASPLTALLPRCLRLAYALHMSLKTIGSINTYTIDRFHLSPDVLSACSKRLSFSRFRGKKRSKKVNSRDIGMPGH